MGDEGPECGQGMSLSGGGAAVSSHRLPLTIVHVLVVIVVVIIC